MNDLLNSKEARKIKYETTAEEIIFAGSRALADMIAEKPHLISIEDELLHAIGATVARWYVDMQEKNNQSI